MQCEHKKRDGRQCKAPALNEKTRCAVHAEPGRLQNSAVEEVDGEQSTVRTI
jgi:hypothetical protein